MTLDIYKQIGNSLRAQEDALRVSIANADNFNTPGFKFSFATFTTILSQTISAGTETVNPQQIGGSMTLGSTTTDFTQGSVGFGTSLDMAISGEGFFVISQSASEFTASSPQLLTRNGRFQTDFNNQFLVDSFGKKVFGFPLNPDGSQASTQMEAIDTGGNTDIGFTDGGILVNNFQANKDAIAAGDPNPPELEPLFQVALATVKNKQGLVLVDGGAYQTTVASGEQVTPDTPGTGIYGDVLGSSLESSNIDVAKVALDMALLNRGFSAIQGVIDDVNKITSNLISKLAA